ncbi:MAG: hypothetical protein K9J74_07905, partial [Sulfuritalea sp.]|nr:hypothetical protein [Sulfuritalea sp.]
MTSAYEKARIATLDVSFFDEHWFFSEWSIGLSPLPLLKFSFDLMEQPYECAYESAFAVCINRRRDNGLR